MTELDRLVHAAKWIEDTHRRSARGGAGGLCHCPLCSALRAYLEAEKADPPMRVPLEDLIVESPKSRNSDPWTAKDAGSEQTARKNGPLHAAMLLLLDQRYGLTNEEMLDVLGGAYSSITTRCFELREAGLVEETGETRPSRFGKSMMVWGLSSLGREYVGANPRHLIELRDRRRRRSA